MVVEKTRAESPVELDEFSCSEDEFCVCRDIVRRAHAGMIHKGADARCAVDVAIRVFRYHHPDTGPIAARELVEHWVLEGHLH